MKKSEILTKSQYPVLWRFLKLLSTNQTNINTDIIIHNLGLDDLKSDSETDDEDNPKKQVPRWAEGSELRTALLKQCYLGPNIDQIFYTVTDPDLSEMFGQAKSRWIEDLLLHVITILTMIFVSRYNKRTSSACWEAAPSSFNHKRWLITMLI